MPDKHDLYSFDRALASGMPAALAGIDEAGRGPLAGPVVAAAVHLTLDDPIVGINDSKKVPAQRRAKLFDEIIARARSYGIGVATVEEIDRVNILQATFLAMQRALDKLTSPWTIALVDGNATIPSLTGNSQMPVIGGDAKSASIAAASILAKVTRDRMMEAYHLEYPHYGFDQHKGYGTALHRERLITHGLCPIHRTSFCGSLVAQTSLDLFPSPTGASS